MKINSPALKLGTVLAATDGILGLILLLVIYTGNNRELGEVCILLLFLLQLPALPLLKVLDMMFDIEKALQMRFAPSSGEPIAYIGTWLFGAAVWFAIGCGIQWMSTRGKAPDPTHERRRNF